MFSSVRRSFASWDSSPETVAAERGGDFCGALCCFCRAGIRLPLLVFALAPSCRGGEIAGGEAGDWPSAVFCFLAALAAAAFALAFAFFLSFSLSFCFSLSSLSLVFACSESLAAAATAICSGLRSFVALLGLGLGFGLWPSGSPMFESLSVSSSLSGPKSLSTSTASTAVEPTSRLSLSVPSVSSVSSFSTAHSPAAGALLLFLFFGVSFCGPYSSRQGPSSLFCRRTMSFSIACRNSTGWLSSVSKGTPFTISSALYTLFGSGCVEVPAIKPCDTSPGRCNSSAVACALATGRTDAGAGRVGAGCTANCGGAE
mmetsp:Transcript_20535/g.78691  ORF Transcript_20535/g.78691 Transcript_20535/m.78691 type:complete len:315 (-) Transcript_20535:882-1826(-)